MKKSLIVSGMCFGTEFLTNLVREVVKKGGKEEDVFEALKTGSDLIPKFAEMIVEKANRARKLSLKFLKLITDNIPIKTDSFTRDSFFKNGSVKLYLWDNFKNQILKALPDSISAFEGTFRKTQLTKNMLDSEILAELNNPQPFTVLEFAALICDLLPKQPNGKDGQLLNNGYANIFYVKLEDGRVVAVGAHWNSGARGWYLDMDGLDDDRWNDGNYVFSRS